MLRKINLSKLITLLIILGTFLIIACKNDQPKVEKQISFSEEELTENRNELETKKDYSEITLSESNGLIDIEKESKIKFGDYFLTFNGDKLGLCCELTLYNPFGELDYRKIKAFLPDFEFKSDTTEYAYKYIYSKDNSIITIVELRPEKSGEEGTFLSEGKLLDNTVTLSNGFKIGMDKKEMLDKYFVYSETAIEELTQIAVCEDPRGELYTKYKFSNDKLIEIEFGSWNE